MYVAAFHGTVTAVAVAGAWYGASAAASAASTVASSALASKTGRVLQALLLSCSGRFAMLLLRGEGRARGGMVGGGRPSQGVGRSVPALSALLAGKRRSVGRLLRALRGTRVGD